LIDRHHIAKYNPDYIGFAEKLDKVEATKVTRIFGAEKSQGKEAKKAYLTPHLGFIFIYTHLLTSVQRH
jgi:hypothetical protein